MKSHKAPCTELLPLSIRMSPQILSAVKNPSGRCEEWKLVLPSLLLLLKNPSVVAEKAKQIEIRTPSKH